MDGSGAVMCMDYSTTWSSDDAFWMRSASPLACQLRCLLRRESRTHTTAWPTVSRSISTWSCCGRLWMERPESYSKPQRSMIASMLPCMVPSPCGRGINEVFVGRTHARYSLAHTDRWLHPRPAVRRSPLAAASSALDRALGELG